MIVRRFFAIALMSAGLGMGLSVVLANHVRPSYDLAVGGGSYLSCAEEIQPNICLGPVQ